MSAYERYGSLEELVSSSEFERIKKDLKLPEDLTLTLGDITTFLKYGDPIVIGLGGSAASGKTTTGLSMVKMLTYIGRPAVYIKFPTEDSYFGKKLYERLNYKKGETGQYPHEGDNVHCRIVDVDWESRMAEVIIEGYCRKAKIEIPGEKGGRFQRVKGIFLERLLDDYKDAKEKGKDLLEDVFRENNRLVCSVEMVDKSHDEILVTPRRWKKSSFAKDSLYMLLNFFENRYYIKRALEEGYHVILDRGTEMEWSIAPPELVNSYLGIWFEGVLRRIANVGKRVNISHIIPAETAVERIEKRKEMGEVGDQSYDDRRTLIRTGLNQITSYFRRKRKVKLVRKKRDLSHLKIPEDFAEEAKRVRGGEIEDEVGGIDASIYLDGQSEVIVDTSSKSKKFVATAGLTMAGIAAAAPILKKIIESILDNQ